jgi:hypothetical protein
VATPGNREQWGMCRVVAMTSRDTSHRDVDISKFGRKRIP